MVLPRMELLFHQQNPDLQEAERVRSFDIVLTLLLGFTIFASYIFLPLKLTVGVAIAVFMASILIGALLAKDNDAAMGHALGYVLSLAYGVLPWILIWDLAVLGSGSRYVILLLAIVWSGDTGAYFGGRFFGKHKLAPRSSPKKTWEGAFAGLLASAIGGYCANRYWNFELGSHSVILIASIVGGFCGQLGDLVESTFKRFARIKDSGAMFPGHGGFLDRCDAVLYAGPVIWLILTINPLLP